MMKISVSAYSFYSYIGQGRLALTDVIGKAHEMGFEAIEFIDLPGTDEEQIALARTLRAQADALGMTVNAYAVGANLYQDTAEAVAAEVERLKRQVDIAALLGCSVMRHDACHRIGKTGNARSFGLMLPTIAAVTRNVTEYAAAKGIRTCVENHGYVVQDSYRVEQLFNAVAHENFGLLVDVGNFVCVDEDNCAAVSRVAPYAVHVHAKDMYQSAVPAPGFSPTRGGRFFKGAIVGEGDMQVERCLQILHRAGYDGYCSLEFEGQEDCLYGIATGLANLKGMIERLG